MPQNRKRRAGTSSKKTRAAAENTKRFKPRISHRDILRKTVRPAPHWKQLTSAQREQRKSAFEFLRLRRQGLTWKDAERLSGASRTAAQRYFPHAFARDKQGDLQVSAHDSYTRHVTVQTATPGKFKSLRARGNHQASLVGKWNNAVKAAGRGDFSLIDVFPRGVVIDGFRLVTSHAAVTRIAKASAEGKNPFEDIYDLAGA